MLDLAALTDVIDNHVVNGAVAFSNSLTNGQVVQSAVGNNLTITIDNVTGSVSVNGKKVITPNVQVKNGVVQ